MAEFAVVFISIFVEALPFLLLGTLISAVVAVFVPDDFIARLFASRSRSALAVAVSAGFLLPICECGIVPIVRGLIRKGAPVYAGVAFLLAAPIVNPIVLASTYYAFPDNFAITFLRAGLGMLIALAAGAFFRTFYAGNPLRGGMYVLPAACACGRHHGASCQGSGRPGLLGKCGDVMLHAGDELIEVGKYLVVGVFLAALLRTVLARETLLAVGQGDLTSVAAMMFFGYVVSLCSEADAFVAAAFNYYFKAGALLAFLVYGPMLDLKNTFLLYSVFKGRFVTTLIVVVTVAVLAAAWLVNILAGEATAHV
ncbi:MAG: permease [Bacillota bacterium]